MNRHRRFHEMLARRHELTPADERRLRQHLEGCSACRETAAAYEHQWRLLQSLSPLEIPPTLRTAVLDRIHATPSSVVPWYRRRASLMAPLGAMALLLVVAVAWAAGSHLVVQRRNKTALSSQASPTTPSPARGKRGASGRPTPLPGATLTARRKRAASAPQGNRASHPHSRNSSAGQTASPTTDPFRPLPTSIPDGAQFTATPVAFGSNASVAAGIPAVSIRRTPPTTVHQSATKPQRSAPTRAVQVTAKPRPTVGLTSGPVSIAAGAATTAVAAPRPPRLAPIQGTPSPVAAAPIAPPVVTLTPVVVATPLPIILPPATPTPVTVVFAAPTTPTPTPTITPLP